MEVGEYLSRAVPLNPPAPPCGNLPAALCFGRSRRTQPARAGAGRRGRSEPFDLRDGAGGMEVRAGGSGRWRGGSRLPRSNHGGGVGGSAGRGVGRTGLGEMETGCDPISWRWESSGDAPALLAAADGRLTRVLPAFQAFLISCLRRALLAFECLAINISTII